MLREEWSGIKGAMGPIATGHPGRVKEHIVLLLLLSFFFQSCSGIRVLYNDLFKKGDFWVLVPGHYTADDTTCYIVINKKAVKRSALRETKKKNMTAFYDLMAYNDHRFVKSVAIYNLSPAHDSLFKECYLKWDFDLEKNEYLVLFDSLARQRNVYIIDWSQENIKPLLNYTILLRVTTPDSMNISEDTLNERILGKVAELHLDTNCYYLPEFRSSCRGMFVDSLNRPFRETGYTCKIFTDSTNLARFQNLFDSIGFIKDSNVNMEVKIEKRRYYYSWFYW